MSVSSSISNSLILAAGFGKRLLPLTQHVPKALIKIQDKPAIDITIKHLQTLPRQNIFVNLHYLPSQIQQHLNVLQQQNGVEVKGIFEEQILNTGGAIKNAFNHIKCQHLLVHNVDAIFYGRSFINDFVQKYNVQYDSYLCLFPKTRYPFATHETGDCNIENNKLEMQKGGEFIFTGLAIHHNRLFIQHNESCFDLMQILQHPNAQVGYYIMEDHNSYWLDMGTNERLTYANNIVLV